MKRIAILLLTLTALLAARAQDHPQGLHLEGIVLEGPIDSLRQELLAHDFTEWGQSDDGEDYYYRGKFYGIRAKLVVTISPTTRLVQSAYVTVGPYSTQKMLEQNMQYFLYKLGRQHGDFSRADDGWVYSDALGSIKVSLTSSDNGSRDINVLYLPLAAYYKDALALGLKGSVQEVVTENAIAEDPFLHFGEDGRIENGDMTDRQYNRLGYLVRARMTEKQGYSDVEFSYNDQWQLVRRTLTNVEAGIRYVNDYIYNEQGEMSDENQRVYEGNECVLTVNMHHQYLTYDDEGNWTSNQLTLNYWEKGSQRQQTQVLQKRTIAYWE